MYVEIQLDDGPFKYLSYSSKDDYSYDRFAGDFKLSDKAKEEIEKYLKRTAKEINQTFKDILKEFPNDAAVK